MTTCADELATGVVSSLQASSQTVATAESLTGGLVVATLVAVPGASMVVRGGICAYDIALKHTLLGVSAAALASGAVNPRVALEMAQGARRVCGADWGIGTTGVAGPDRAPDAEVGTVFIAVAGPHELECVRQYDLGGDRAHVRGESVRRALTMLLEDCAQ